MALLILSDCATAAPKEGAVIAVEPNLPESPPSGATADAAEPAPTTSALLEPLAPVRGGQRVLPPYRGSEPCRMALTGESPVAKACSDGGLRRAMELMQTFVKRAEAEGFPFVCTDCHAEEDDYTRLTPIADGEFRKLLFLARPE
jgi:hypothetical protein